MNNDLMYGILNRDNRRKVEDINDGMFRLVNENS